MPELPEVETMVRSLRPVLECRRIESVRVSDPFVLDGIGRRLFERALSGAAIQRVWRRGKWVVFDLLDGHFTLIQLRMTGGFRVGLQQPPRYSRIHFRIDGPYRDLWYCDLRRLSRVAWLDHAGLERKLSREHQGLEATEITRAQLAQLLARTRRPIKAALLDQRLLAGIGNIYADESLFDAGIHPQRKCHQLTSEEVRRLCRSIHRILKLAIRLEGTTVRNYCNVFGQAGSFQDRHRVYGKEGKPCVRCGQGVVRANIKGLIGRSTHYCPACQS